MLAFNTFFRAITENSLIGTTRTGFGKTANDVTQTELFLRLIKIGDSSYVPENKDSFEKTLAKVKAGILPKSKSQYYPIAKDYYRSAFLKEIGESYARALNKMVDIVNMFWKTGITPLRNKAAAVILGLIEQDEKIGANAKLGCITKKQLLDNKGTVEFAVLLLEAWTYVIKDLADIDPCADDSLEYASDYYGFHSDLKALDVDKRPEDSHFGDAIDAVDTEVVNDDAVCEDNINQTYVKPEKQTISIQNIFVNNNCGVVNEHYINGNATIINGKVVDDKDGK